MDRSKDALWVQGHTRCPDAPQDTLKALLVFCPIAAPNQHVVEMANHVPASLQHARHASPKVLWSRTDTEWQLIKHIPPKRRPRHSQQYGPRSRTTW